MERSQLFAQGLRSDDPAERAAALAGLEPEMTADADLVRAAFALLRDDAEVPAAWRPTRAVDPFASFFGETPEEPSFTLAHLAAERLVALGVPGTAETVEAIRDTLTASAPSELLSSTTARLIPATLWADELEVVRALVPPLLSAGASLFEALPGLSRPALREIIDLALAPFNARALNELLNHPQASDACAETLVAAIVQGRWVPTEAEAVEVLPLLAVWGHKDPVTAGGAAATLEARFPWASAFGAFDNEAAARRFRAFMDSGAPAPDKLKPVLNGALRDRPDLPFFPLEAWLRWSDGEAHLIEEWKRGGACRELLYEWVRAWDDTGARAERAWDAMLVLLGVDAHEPIQPILSRRLAEAPFESEFYKRLGAARPQVPGAFEAVAAKLVAEPEHVATLQPALLTLQGDLRPYLDTLLARIEAAPWVEEASKRGLKMQVKAGFDVRSLRAVVEHVGDAGLTERFDGVLPRKG